jgi:predicted DNA-binding transcriptional regulator YafY
MNRIDRLMGIVTHLQSRKFVTAEKLADHFAISVRTVYRDVKALTEIGVPVGYDNPKGYFIAKGYFLPPVSFTAEEANALILMDTIVRRFSNATVRQHYDRALSKIKATLDTTQKSKLEQLSGSIKTLPAEDQRVNFSFLTDIQNALASKTTLSIEYSDYHGQPTQREVEPIGLTFYAMNWHMIAWCWKRKAYRDFNLARIRKLKSTGSPFRKSGHRTLDQHLNETEKFLNALP